MTIKVLLKFLKFKDADLITFVLQCISKTDGVEEYAMLQSQVDIVKESSEAFIKAVEAASDGGKLLVYLRKQEKLNLLQDMKKLALLVELNADGDEAFVLGAGFNLRSKPQRSNTPLGKPVLKYLRRGKKSGTVEGELVDFPKGVREFNLLYSTDNGITKTNGTSTSGKRFIIDLGFTEKRVQVSGYFIGTFQRKSDECEPMEVFVL